METCPHCHKDFPLKGLHTHISRAHGTSEVKAKYSSGHHGRYHTASFKENMKIALLKRFNISEETRICLYCSNEFVVLSSDTKKFCTMSCSAKFNNRKRYGEKPPPKPPRKIYQFINLTCVVCGSNFSVKEYHKKTTCSSDCRRKHPNCGGKRNSIRFMYNGISLDSSYELQLAISLDDNKIEWTRPKPFTYKVDEKTKRYYPDFYLPQYGIYLDPKNDYLIMQDREKIDLVQKQNGIKVIVLNSQELSWGHVEQKIKSGEEES